MLNVREAGEEVDTQIIGRLREWLLASSSHGATIGLDTHLIDEGILDSLQMVNFLLYIEELRGREIPEALIQPDYFTSLRTIHSTFFSH